MSGTWRELTNNVNQLASNLTDQVRNIAEVTTAVANGDLDQKITVDAQGETLALKNTVNTMVAQLRSFADEVTRVAREVGTEGKLGGQARVHGVSGTWADLTENVNFMAGNLTDQVRNIAEVTTAVAAGDLDQEITVQAQGEILELKNTVNTMVAQLRSFAGEVTRVAKEVGTEGKLGGQAEVEGASGTWKALTDNVNQLASNLTDQVRAIAEVSTAVTQGDLTREVTVKARGEVADMSDNINRMIVTLRETTDKNAQQDWLNSNLARFSSMMQGQRDLESFSQLIMSELTPLVDAHHGAFFVADEADSDRPAVRLVASYGYTERKELSSRFAPGEGLVGQSVLEKKAIVLTRAPADYVTISSGLGQGAPNSIIVIPVVFEDQVMAVIELASFDRFTDTQKTFLDQLTETIGVVLNTIVASTRTEQLLMQSQTLTQELQSQSEELRVQQDGLKASNEELGAQAQSLKASEERLQAQQEQLRQSNEQLEQKAAQLAGQNAETELRNSEIEKARADVELKAQQLAVSSRYKSQFLANMSHELRTPLNSLLILAKLLRDNRDGNLTSKQVEYAATVYAAGQDLVVLINNILDLSKVEAGKMDIDVTAVQITGLTDHIEATFRPVADQKELAFAVRVAPDVPEVVSTDDMRLRQVLKNLLSNAFKFTDAGAVSLDVFRADDGAYEVPALAAASGVVAFRVSDSGVGIAPGKLQSIFEAFQQADGTTSRKYGGTGLGLSISREIARLLSGEVQVDSTEGRGSTFTLFIPVEHPGDEGAAAAPAAFPATPHSSPARGRAVGPAPGRSLALAPPPPPPPAAAGPSLRAVLPPADMADDRAGSAGGERTVLIIEDDATFAGLMLGVAREQGFNGIVALRGDHGLQLARTLRPDAVMLDLQLPVITGMEVLEQLKSDPATRHMPVNVVSGLELRQAAMALGTIAYFDKPIAGEDLVQAFSGLSELLDRDAAAAGPPPAPGPPPEPGPLHVLIVDDDARNVFALTAAMEGFGLEVVYADCGPDAITALHEHAEIDVVLMDIMMPGMDGYETMQAIRSEARYAELPIIALTAKAMTADRAKCLQAGASDYITKPMDTEALIALIRRWTSTPAPGLAPAGA